MSLTADRLSAAAITLALLLSLAALPARAADGQKGLYLSGAAGVNLPADSELDTSSASQEAEFDAGFAGAAAIGYAYGNGVRSEFELGSRGNDVDSVSGASGSGDVGIFSIMGNAYYDIPVQGPLTPFVGAGIGVGFVDADGISPVSGSRIDDDDTGFALQVIGGVAYTVTDRLDLTLSYRYFAMPDLEFRTASGGSVDSDYQSHAVMVGLRFSFGAPAPAPPPAPRPAAAPEPAPMPPPAPRAEPAPPPAPVPRNYLVFFDWDSAVLTAEAKGILATAAANAGKVGTMRIEATGHADRSGPERYNVRLSQRRAAAVRAELVRLGIPADEIAIFAKGETQPLVPTADGVREPQNRRVEVVLK